MIEQVHELVALPSHAYDAPEQEVALSRDARCYQAPEQKVKLSAGAICFVGNFRTRLNIGS